MGRHANVDIKQAFVEFGDDASPSKCTKVRCLHCGFVRAKNTTRQIEHLQDCAQYLSSGQVSTAIVPLSHVDSASNIQSSTNTAGGIFSGSHPNPNLHITRKGPHPKRNRGSYNVVSAGARPTGPQLSLSTHLLNANQALFNPTFQQPFIQACGTSTLSAQSFRHWAAQDWHLLRGLIQFISTLIAKIRLPQGPTNLDDIMYRTLDLLLTALNNTRRDMAFFDDTVVEYNIPLSQEPVNFITRAYLDLLTSAASPGASILEGLVVFWITNHCFRTAWYYARAGAGNYMSASVEPHLVGLHVALIPNWTSDRAGLFLNACRGLVDDIAVSPAITNGREEMARCDQAFRQVCFLTERFWPVMNVVVTAPTSPAHHHASPATAAAATQSAVPSASVSSSDFAVASGSAASTSGPSTVPVPVASPDSQAITNSVPSTVPLVPSTSIDENETNAEAVTDDDYKNENDNSSTGSDLRLQPSMSQLHNDLQRLQDLQPESVSKEQQDYNMRAQLQHLKQQQQQHGENQPHSHFQHYAQLGERQFQHQSHQKKA